MRLTIQRDSLSMRNIQGLAAEWSLILVVLCYPIVASTTILIGLPNRPVAILYRAIYLMLALLVIHIEVVSWRSAVRRYSIYIFMVALFWLAYLCRMCYDLLYLEAESPLLNRTGFMFFFQYGILGSCIPALGIAMGIKSINFQRLFKWMRIVSAPLIFMLFLVIYKQYGLSLEVFIERIALGEEDEKTISPIIMSRHGGIVCVLALYHMYLTRIGMYDVLLFVLGFATLILGASRGPMIAVCLVFILMTVFFIKQRFKALKTWRNLSIFSLIIIGLLMRYFSVLVERVNLLHRVELSVEQGQGMSERENVWRTSWQQFLDSPIYGEHIVERYYGFYPHNVILEILMATGLIGFMILLPVFWKVLYNIFVIVDPYKRVLLYLFILLFVFVFFSSAIITMPHFWVVLSLVAAMNSSAKSERTVSVK